MLFVLALPLTAVVAARQPDPVAPPPLNGAYTCVQTAHGTTLSSPGMPSVVTTTQQANLFGDLILDARGNYRMTGGRGIAGRYNHDAATGAVRFTGMLQGFANNYQVGNGRVAFDFSAGAISMSCSRTGSRFAGVASARVDPSGTAVPRPSAAPNGALTGTLFFNDQEGLRKLDLALGSTVFVREARAFDISPDGQMVWVNTAGELMQGGATGPVRRVNTYGQNDDPRIAPDGNRIAYMGEQMPTSVESAMSGALTAANVQPIVIDRMGKVIATLGTEYQQPVWTRDGRIVVAGRKASGTLAGNAKSGIFISDTRFRGLRRIDPGYELPHSPSVSPDGTRIAFVSGRSIVVMNIDGTNARGIANGRTALVYSPTWAPNSSAIIYRDSRELWLSPLQGEPRAIKSKEGYPISGVGTLFWFQ